MAFRDRKLFLLEFLASSRSDSDQDSMLARVIILSRNFEIISLHEKLSFCLLFRLWEAIISHVTSPDILYILNLFFTKTISLNISKHHQLISWKYRGKNTENVRWIKNYSQHCIVKYAKKTTKGLIQKLLDVILVMDTVSTTISVII